MSSINFQKQQLKLKQIQRHLKQNVTITNLYTNKLVKPKPVFRFMPSIIPPSLVVEPIVVIEPVLSVIEPVLSVVEPIVVVEPVLSVVEPILNVVEPILNVVEPIVIVEPVTITSNNNFTLQYIKSKIMSDYGNLYKSA